MSPRTLSERISLGQQVIKARQTGTRTASIAPTLGVPLRTAQRYALLAETNGSTGPFTALTVPTLAIQPPTPVALDTTATATILVFGSNRLGRHGGGAAKIACQHHGAIWGQGEGLQGQSYALPTCKCPTTWRNSEITLEELQEHVDTFLSVAAQRPDLTFRVTRIGCGYARFTDTQVASMFANATSNCFFDTEWHSYLGDRHKYWGTF